MRSDLLTDPHQLVVATLARLESRLREGDLHGAVACFVPDGAIYGADLGEEAHGTEELTSFLEAVLDHGLSIGWDVEETWVRSSGEHLWFVATATVVLRDGEAEVSREPLRMSGILRGSRGYYRFELFNGTQPLTRPALRLVGSH